MVSFYTFLACFGLGGGRGKDVGKRILEELGSSFVEYVFLLGSGYSFCA